MRLLTVVLSLSLVLSEIACSTPHATRASSEYTLHPVGTTIPVAHDPDDPAIWRSPRDPARALLLGTDKTAQAGGLYVFGLDGQIRQVIAPLDRPNNVDVEYGIQLADGPHDIAVVTERLQHRLRVFNIPDDGGMLTDLAPNGIPVLEGATGEMAEPMGIALYRRPNDGAVFAIVAPKTGGATDYLWQYRLEDDGEGSIKGTLVRRFGDFSGVGTYESDAGEIEAVTVDDELGYVYYSDERYGIRKYSADPDSPNRSRELAVLGASGYRGDREGLALYATGPKTGYLVSSDQLPGATRIFLYSREGVNGNAHQQPCLAAVPTESDSTDGLEVAEAALPHFAKGLLLMMNSRERNFLMYDWADVEKQLALTSPSDRCN